jgi:MtN3 and saliva related transmembrane protein
MAPALAVNAIGTAAALCSMSSFAPQIIKLLKTRDASGVSLRTYAVTVSGFGLWIAYGVLLRSWPVAGSNAVCLAMSTAILALKWRFDHAPGARPRS